MKKIQIFCALLATIFVLETNTAQAQENKPEKQKKGWSKKGKGAAIGAGTGAVGGAVIGGTKGAVIGAGAGAVGGAIIGKKKDKKKDPERYKQYSDKNKKD